jgi:putative membrane protein
METKKTLLFFIVVVAIVFVWSLIHPHDYFTWILEVFPAIVGFLILAFTYHRFKFTTLTYALIAIHMIILIIGGHYTYAEVPLFNWIRDTLHQSRNNYDRVGHFAQGFVPAIITREMLLRLGVLKRRRWMFFIVVSICLAISALYELFEWRVAVAFGGAADSFLGTQGDVWDTKDDMSTSLVGASVAMLTMGRVHDRFLEKIEAAKL